MALAESNFNLENFKTQVLGKGLSRTNRFEVIILPPLSLEKYQAEIASLLADATNLPPINMEIQSQKIFGPRYYRPKSYEMGGDGLIINFLVDRDMVAKRFFEDWIDLVIEPETYLVKYQNNYLGRIELKQLDEKEEITYNVTLIDVFPRSMNIMELNNSSNGNFHRLAITFTYRRWTSKPIGAKSDVRTIAPNPFVREDIVRNREQSSKLDNNVSTASNPTTILEPNTEQPYVAS